jgi:hypothetical protein
MKPKQSQPKPAPVIDTAAGDAALKQALNVRKPSTGWPWEAKKNKANKTKGTKS